MSSVWESSNSDLRLVSKLVDVILKERAHEARVDERDKMLVSFEVDVGRLLLSPVLKWKHFIAGSLVGRVQQRWECSNVEYDVCVYIWFLLYYVIFKVKKRLLVGFLY